MLKNPIRNLGKERALPITCRLEADLKKIQHQQHAFPHNAEKGKKTKWLNVASNTKLGQSLRGLIIVFKVGIFKET